MLHEFMACGQPQIVAAIEIENENESKRIDTKLCWICVLKLSLINVLSFSMTLKLSLKSIGSAIEVLINAIASFFSYYWEG